MILLNWFILIEKSLERLTVFDHSGRFSLFFFFYRFSNFRRILNDWLVISLSIVTKRRELRLFENILNDQENRVLFLFAWLFSNSKKKFYFLSQKLQDVLHHAFYLKIQKLLTKTLLENKQNRLSRYLFSMIFSGFLKKCANNPCLIFFLKILA